MKLSIKPIQHGYFGTVYLVGNTVCCRTIDEAEAFANGEVAPDYIREIYDGGARPVRPVRSAPLGHGTLDKFPWEQAA